MSSSAPRASEPDATSTALAITWLGHATVLVEIDGVRMITDPVLRDRIGPLVRIAPDVDLAGPVDCVLLSHLHADHTDLPTLRALERSGPVLAPYPAREWLTATRAPRRARAPSRRGDRRRRAADRRHRGGARLRGAGRSGRRPSRSGT